MSRFNVMPRDIEQRIRAEAINPNDVRSWIVNPDGSLTLEVYDAIDAPAILNGTFKPEWGANIKTIEVPT